MLPSSSPPRITLSPVNADLDSDSEAEPWATEAGNRPESDSEAEEDIALYKAVQVSELNTSNPSLTGQTLWDAQDSVEQDSVTTTVNSSSSNFANINFVTNIGGFDRPFKALLDTGAYENVVNHDLLQRWGITSKIHVPVKDEILHAFGGGSITVMGRIKLQFRAPELRDGAPFSLMFYVVEGSHFGAKETWDAILGITFCDKFLYLKPRHG